MPYVDEAVKKRLEPQSRPQTKDAGELTYRLYKEIMEYWMQFKPEIFRSSMGSYETGNMTDVHDHSFQKISDILGALETCKQEFYRREAAPYEDEKLAVNGDV